MSQRFGGATLDAAGVGERMPGGATGRERAVRFVDVVQRFGQVRALEEASFEIARGETVALLGPNGAGKSTAIALLLGLRRPDSGQVLVFEGSPEAARATGRVGAMLQSGGLLPGVTVGELVDMVRRLYPRPLPLAEVLARAGLADLARRRVDRLSGGQAQRVRFALAIAGNPELFFLDEPTVAMDVESRQVFWHGVRAFAAEGRTILFATHYLEEADAVADRVIVLQRGRVVAAGPVEAIKSAVRLRSVRFTLPGVELATLRALPGVQDGERHGDTVQLRTADTDATVRALYAGGFPLRDLEVTGADLEEAFLSLTRQPAAPPAA